MNQSTLNFDVRAPHNRSETSRLGAEAAIPHTRWQSEVILVHVRESGERGMTNNEIQAATELPINVVTARRNALVKRGLLVVSGTRKSAAGCENDVVKALPSAEACA